MKFMYGFVPSSKHSILYDDFVEMFYWIWCFDHDQRSRLAMRLDSILCGTSFAESSEKSDTESYFKPWKLCWFLSSRSVKLGSISFRVKLFVWIKLFYVRNMRQNGHSIRHLNQNVIPFHSKLRVEMVYQYFISIPNNTVQSYRKKSINFR